MWRKEWVLTVSWWQRLISDHGGIPLVQMCQNAKLCLQTYCQKYNNFFSPTSIMTISCNLIPFIQRNYFIMCTQQNKPARVYHCPWHGIWSNDEWHMYQNYRPSTVCFSFFSEWSPEPAYSPHWQWYSDIEWCVNDCVFSILCSDLCPKPKAYVHLHMSLMTFSYCWIGTFGFWSSPVPWPPAKVIRSGLEQNSFINCIVTSMQMFNTRSQ